MNNLDKRVFGTLFFSIFSSITGVGIVVPLLPVYAHELGASGLYIGMIFGAFALSRTLFLPYFGRQSDRLGRKPYIVTGLLGYTLISFAFILATRVELIILIRFIQGIASAMIMPVTQAYIGEITPVNREGAVMGLFNVSVFIGLSIGPLLGGVLKDRFSLDAAFMAMGMLSAIGFLLSLLLLPPRREEQTTRKGRSESLPWKGLLKDRQIDGLFIFRFVYTAAIGTIWGFLPVFADTEFTLSSSAIGLLIMLGVFISGLLQAPMGYLADILNKRRMIVVGGMIVVCAMWWFKSAEGFWDLFGANILFGIGGSMSMAPLMAIAVQKGAEMRAMGGIMGLMTMAHSLGMLSGAVATGLLMEHIDIRRAFLFAAVWVLIGTAVFVLLTTPRGDRRSTFRPHR